MDVTYWLDPAYRLVESIVAGTGVLVYAVGFGIFWLLLLMFLYWSEGSRR